jgi:O-antigen biosynthesis protein WbqP
MNGGFTKVYLIVKRILDFTLSLVALLILWPIFLLIIFLIKLDTKGPVFFKQKRIGKNKKEFYILKFRTMKTDAPKDMPTHKLKNPEVYITKMGVFLRKSSLDELPQIINILKFEMSIVGPRPALWNQYDLIAERDKYGANEIVPGLTGLAQVNGRDGLLIPKKAELDGYYANNICIGMDVKICFMTILSVVTREGVVEGIQPNTVHSNVREGIKLTSSNFRGRQ